MPRDDLRLLISRRRFLRLASTGLAALGVGVGVGVAGCSRPDSDLDRGAATTGAGAGTSAGAGGAHFDGALALYSWEEYSSPENLAAFTERFGATVGVEFYDSNEQLISALQEGRPSDVVAPSNSYLPQLIAGGLLTALDHDRLPNLASVDPAFLGRPWDPDDAYAVVKSWGSTGFIYDTTVIREDLSSWADYFRVAGQEGVSGKVSALEERSVVDAALWREGFDFRTDDPVELDRAEQILTDELLPHLLALNSFPVDELLDGSYVLSQAFSGDARIVVLEFPERYRWVLPTPHTELWIDHWAIPSTSERPEAAHAFIDYMLAPTVSARELSHHGYATAVNGIDEFLPFDLPASDMVFFEPESLGRMLSYEAPATEERRNELVAALLAGIDARG